MAVFFLSVVVDDDWVHLVNRWIYWLIKPLIFGATQRSLILLTLRKRRGVVSAHWADYTVIIHDDVTKWKHFPRYWLFVRGTHRSPVNYPQKGQWRGALMFVFYLCLNKRLSKQSWGWWFSTLSHSFWRHCNVMQDFNVMLKETNAHLTGYPETDNGAIKQIEQRSTNGR